MWGWCISFKPSHHFSVSVSSPLETSEKGWKATVQPHRLAAHLILVLTSLEGFPLIAEVPYLECLCSEQMLWWCEKAQGCVSQLRKVPFISCTTISTGHCLRRCWKSMIQNGSGVLPSITLSSQNNRDG